MQHLSKSELIDMVRELQQKYDSLQATAEKRFEEKETEKVILENLINASEDFIQSTAETPDYNAMLKTVFEISGAKYGSFNVFDDCDPGLAWENDVRGYWIHLGREFDGRQNYYSVEERLSLKWHRWTLSGMGWVGQQMFAVRNQGFALYNMAEDHRGGYGAEIRHAFGRHLEIGFRFSREHFRDLAITPNATSESYMALLAWNF